MPLTRAQLEDLAVNRYFLAVNRREMDTIMDTFADDCVMRFPGRAFRYNDKAALKVHFEDFLSNFPVVHFRDFLVAADEQAQTVAVTFLIDLTDHDGEVTKMNNINFFRVDPDGLFSEIIIYASGNIQKGFEEGSAG